MGFLSPAMLVLGLAVAVPLVIHLFQRQQGPRIVFPALRYLRRAEKENARRIKLRQLLLLALRLSIIVLLVMAAARPFVRRGTGEHEPTAVAIVLDNSLSSGLVVGDRRVLDQLKERALETLAAAGPNDRFWLIRPGAPWEPAVPGDAETTAARVRATEVAANGADLTGSLRRARTLLAAGADGRATEIHLLSDLQATGFPDPLAAEGDPPALIVWAPRLVPPPNAGVTGVEVGGGLAPRAGQRSTVAVRIGGSRDGDSILVRLALDGRISAAATAPPGGTALLPFPARSAGLVSGWIELDPDALRGDDRRFFVARVQPPPAVALTTPVPFVEEALDVLAGAGRLRRATADAAELVIAPAANGVRVLRAGRTALILAPSSPLELPAANNRLAAAGVPWRFAVPDARGEARFEVPEEGDDLLAALQGARVREYYVLEPAAGGPDRTAATGAPAAADSVLLRLRDGSPWALRGELPGRGRYLLVASSFMAEASTLPTSAAMLPLLDRLLGPWAAVQVGTAEASPGDHVPLPPHATAVERPDGRRDPVEGGTRYRVPAEPGVYRILAADQITDAFAVNPPPSESELQWADSRRLGSLLPGWSMRVADQPGEWSREIFQRRLGREIWRPLLLLALAALLVEALVASAGTRAGARPRATGTAGRASAPGGNTPPAEPPLRDRRPVPSHARPVTS